MICVKKLAKKFGIPIGLIDRFDIDNWHELFSLMCNEVRKPKVGDIIVFNRNNELHTGIILTQKGIIHWSEGKWKRDIYLPEEVIKFGRLKCRKNLHQF